MSQELTSLRALVAEFRSETCTHMRPFTEVERLARAGCADQLEAWIEAWDAELLTAAKGFVVGPKWIQAKMLGVKE